MSEQALQKVETHEKECALRYKYIEKELKGLQVRLEKGNTRFTKLEAMIWGLYVVTAGFGMGKFMGL